MNCLELKNSLQKFPGDFNRAEIILITKNSKGEKQYSLLAATSQILIGQECIGLISDEVCRDMLAEGKLKFKKDLDENDIENL